MCRPETPVDALALMPSRWARKQKERPKQKKRSQQAIADEYRKVMDSRAGKV